MTGPQHFRRAELLAQQAQASMGEGSQEAAVAWAAIGQIHAALALAAATAIDPDRQREDWHEAAGTTQ